MYPKTQKFCAWSGVVGVLVFFVGLLVAGWIPPPGPSTPMNEVVADYQNNTNSIRFGMILVCLSGVFMGPMYAVLYIHMRRIEGATPIMSLIQIIAGTTNVLFFFLPGIFFTIVAFRPDRSPELTYMLNDAAWIMLIIPWMAALGQNIAVGFCIFNNPDNTIFPRWLGYFSFWVAIGYLPSVVLGFFHSGPLAWNGLFPFYLAGFFFFNWYLVMAQQITKAVNRQQIESEVAA
jgi:hypothetical protein